MQLALTIGLDNEAFGETDEERAEEAAQILAQLARRLRTDGLPRGEDWRLKDANGNKVGSVSLSGEA